MDGMDTFWSDIYSLIPTIEEKERKDILFSTCIMLLEAIAQTHNPDYIKDEVQHKIAALAFDIKMSTYTSTAIKAFKKNNNFFQFRNKNNIEFLMGILALNKHFELEEDSIEFDATSYAAIKSGFCQGKFQPNDLVDIYNVAFVANKQEEFDYYTEEERWQDFVTIEKNNGKI